MKEIRFYKVNEPYGFFSNFSSYPIFIAGEIWRTVEHYFQAKKFENVELRNKIKSFDSPMEAAKEGRNPQNIIRKDWEDVKEIVMKNALYAKFLQHPDLKKKLLSTYDSLIIEDTSNDSFWGNGGNGTGKNRLGVLLMEVRNDILALSPDPDVIFPPWIAFPGVSQYDLFWRMGLGEEYLTQWSSYYLKLKDKEMYKQKFKPSIEWEDIYE